MQEKTLWRGILSSPYGADACRFHPDGGLVVQGGRIEALGDFDSLRSAFPRVAVVQSPHEPWLLLPGFVDVHLHWVQNRVKGSFQEALLPWLQNHIWPEEARFVDSAFAEVMVERFYSELASKGTVAAMIYSSVHASACRLALSKGYGRMIVGDVVMTQNSPPDLLTDEDVALAQVRELGREFGDRYAVTPRFAITCGESCLDRLGQAAADNGNWIQSHLSENTDEIAWVKKLFPKAAHYTDVYDRAGLLGERTILGHCIHLSDNEWRLLKARGVNVAHCPTSNRALRSGRMPLEKLREFDIPFALASDIGGGPSLSPLNVMKAFLEDHAPFTRVTATEALFRSTLAGAEILRMDHRLGSLVQGKEASFVALKTNGPAKNTAEEQLRDLLSNDPDDLENLVASTVVDGKVIYTA